jgi:WD40 repeat protein
VAINAETTLLATASWDSTVKLYDLQSQEVIRTMGSEESEKMSGLYSIAFSKTQAEILGCTSADYNVYLWNYNTGALQCALRGHENEVNGIDFHSTQQVVATASDDHKCIVWDMEQREALRVLDQHTKPVYGCVFMGMENQYLVATCCFDLNTRIFDMRSSDVVACIQTHADDITGIDYSSGKQLLATGSDDGKISIVDARQRRLLQQLDTREVLPENEVKRLAFSQCGNLLAASCSTGKVLVYSVNESSAKQVAVLGGHADCIFDVAWGVTDDGSKLLASASHDHTVGLWKEVL